MCQLKALVLVLGHYSNSIDRSHRLVTFLYVNLSKSSVCCVSSVMASEVEFWRQDPATKAEGIAREVERLSCQARAAGLLVTAYILGLAVEEARKEAGTEDGKVQHASSWRHGVRT